MNAAKAPAIAPAQQGTIGFQGVLATVRTARMTMEGLDERPGRSRDYRCDLSSSAFRILARPPALLGFFWRLFLNVLLVLGALGLLSKIWSIFVILAHLNVRLLISPSRDPFIDMLSSAGLALALYGVWRRRKWGAYLIFVRLAFTIVMQIFIYHSLNWRLTRGYTGRENVWADVLGAAMWLLAFWRTWGYFR